MAEDQDDKLPVPTLRFRCTFCEENKSYVTVLGQSIICADCVRGANAAFARSRLSRERIAAFVEEHSGP